MKKMFVFLVCTTIAAFMLFSIMAPAQAGAADWKPSKPITLTVGYGPGGGFDIWARAIAGVLTKQVGVPVVVENIPGLGGVTALESLWRTKPDGYTIHLFELASMLIAQYLTKAKYDLRQCTPIGIAQVGTRALWAAKASPFNSIQDVVKAGKSRTLRGGTTGLSSGLWLAMAVFASEAGIDVKPVSGYKSGAELLTALEAGDFDIVVMPPVTAMPFVERGSVRCLALGGSSHDPRLPGVPTYKEVGYPKTGAFSRVVRSLIAPPGTPPAAAAFLEKSLMDALRSPEFVKWLESQGEDVGALNAQQMRQELKDTDEIVKEFLPILKPYM